MSVPTAGGNRSAVSCRRNPLSGLQPGKHVLIGGIAAENIASRALHTRLGFEQVAHFKQVGRKFARWLDLLFMQKDA